MPSRVLRPPLTDEQRAERARIAALSRHDPKRAAAVQKDFHVDRLAQQIERLAEEAPPLTDEQVTRLRRAFAPVAEGGAR